MDLSSLRRVRAGVLALPIAGLFWTVGILLRGAPNSTAVDPAATASVLGSANYIAGWLAITIGEVLLLLGFPALYAVLNSRNAGRLAFAGVTLSLLGTGLLLPLFGITTFTYATAGQLYLAGQTGAMTVVDNTFGGPLIPFVMVGALCYSAGAIIFGIASWRSRLVPAWVAVAFALHAPLANVPLTQISELLGGVLLAISGAVLARSAMQDRISEPTVQNHVFT